MFLAIDNIGTSEILGQCYASKINLSEKSFCLEEVWEKFCRIFLPLPCHSTQAFLCVENYSIVQNSKSILHINQHKTTPTRTIV